jgi:CheY-like chemotaxis protein
MPTILVADDNRLSRELLRDVLAGTGWQVVMASDGQEVLERLEAILPDLVLLDLEMPAKDGFAVLGEMRGNPRLAAIPVAALTARAMQADRERIEAAGFDAYLTKPIKPHELRARVAQLLNLNRKIGDL